MRLPMSIHQLHEEDHPKLIKLWQASGGIEVRQTDTAEALARFLYRNPTCNYAAYAGTRLVGAVLAGHDGWRGYLYHMAVKPNYHERGVGTKLVSVAVDAIKREGIPKVHCLVKRDNLIAQQFWEACGFTFRDDLFDYSV
jgi:ribosomal protein S18 acetylase RimI-like enzyme